MNGKTIEQELEVATFSARSAMKWVVLSYIWRTAVLLAALAAVCVWLVYPKLPTLAIVLEIVGAVIFVFECVRRILRCRVHLEFIGTSLQVNDYCHSSFRLDGLSKQDFVLVQNPSERRVNTGRILICQKGIYLRGVGSFKELSAYIEQNFA